MESRASTPPWLWDGRRWCTKLMCQTSCARCGAQNSACRPGVQSLACKCPIPALKTQQTKLTCKNPVCRSQHAKPLCKTLRAEPGRTQHARPNVQNPVCKARPYRLLSVHPRCIPSLQRSRTHYRLSVAEPRTALLSPKCTWGNKFPPLWQSSVSGWVMTVNLRTQRNAQRQISGSRCTHTGVIN